MGDGELAGADEWTDVVIAGVDGWPLYLTDHPFAAPGAFGGALLDHLAQLLGTTQPDTRKGPGH